MGRTLPTAPMLIEQTRKRWAGCRRKLPKEEQAMLDEMITDAHHNRHAMAYTDWTMAYKPILIYPLLEPLKALMTDEPSCSTSRPI